MQIKGPSLKMWSLTMSNASRYVVICPIPSSYVLSSFLLISHFLGQRSLAIITRKKSNSSLLADPFVVSKIVQAYEIMWVDNCHQLVVGWLKFSNMDYKLNHKAEFAFFGWNTTVFPLTKEDFSQFPSGICGVKILCSRDSVTHWTGTRGARNNCVVLEDHKVILTINNIILF